MWFFSALFKTNVAFLFRKGGKSRFLTGLQSLPLAQSQIRGHCPMSGVRQKSYRATNCGHRRLDTRHWTPDIAHQRQDVWHRSHKSILLLERLLIMTKIALDNLPISCEFTQESNYVFIYFNSASVSKIFYCSSFLFQFLSLRSFSVPFVRCPVTPCLVSDQEVTLQIPPLPFPALRAGKIFYLRNP